jgi:hypothetical protein
MAEYDCVSLWGNFTDGEYTDKIAYESRDTMIVNYCGQKGATYDKHIGSGNYFFYKNKKSGEYTFAGRVIQSHLIRTEVQDKKNINIYELVISKEPVLTFRVKHDAYKHFGWKKNGQDFRRGIIKHVM